MSKYTDLKEILGQLFKRFGKLNMQYAGNMQKKLRWTSASRSTVRVTLVYSIK